MQAPGHYGRRGKEGISRVFPVKSRRTSHPTPPHHTIPPHPPCHPAHPAGHPCQRDWLAGWLVGWLACWLQTDQSTERFTDTFLHSPAGACDIHAQLHTSIHGHMRIHLVVCAYYGAWRPGVVCRGSACCLAGRVNSRAAHTQRNELILILGLSPLLRPPFSPRCLALSVLLSVLYVCVAVRVGLSASQAECDFAERIKRCVQ